MTVRPNAGNPQGGEQWQSQSQQYSGQQQYPNQNYQQGQYEGQQSWGAPNASGPYGSSNDYYSSQERPQQYPGNWAPQQNQYPSGNSSYYDQHSGYNESPRPYDPHAPIYNSAASPPPNQGHGSPFASSAPPPDRPNSSTGTPQQQQYQQQHQPSQNPDDDRGVMGALGGAAAGGFAGHKVHHGVLGALGGAFAGHKLEDAYKQHHDQSLQGQGQGQGQGPPQQQHQNQGPPPRGNFAASSAEIRLEGGRELVAQAGRVDGSRRHARLDLNGVLTNSDGRLEWARGGNFAASARQTHLAEGGRELRAELCDVQGRWVRSSIRLDERITNNDGELEMLW